MKRLWVLMLLACTACTQTQRITSFFDETFEVSEESLVQKNSPSKTVSMLLPVTGEQSTVGQNMQNGALMAIKENSNAPVRLLFFDTKGTPDGAKEAYRWAKAQNSDLILGPVFSSELQALKSGLTLGPDILSYTSDSTVLDDHHASFAMLIDNQIDTIVQQACTTGKFRMAALGPNGKTGEIVMNALDKAIQKCPEMKLTKYGFYEEKEENLTPAILKILPRIIDAKKKDLTEEEKQILATPMEERVDFDSLIVFEEGIRLSQVMAILAFYDVNPSILPIYTLANVKNMKDKALNGVLFADVDEGKSIPLTRKYMTLFNQKPNTLTSLAYDSVSWVAQASYNDTLNLNTLREEVYEGSDGLIRLNEDGTNTRGLRLVKKMGKNTMEVAPAPQTLEKNETFKEPTSESTDLTLVSPEASGESLEPSVQSNVFEAPVQGQTDSSPLQDNKPDATEVP